MVYDKYQKWSQIEWEEEIDEICLGGFKIISCLNLFIKKRKERDDERYTSTL